MLENLKEYQIKNLVTIRGSDHDSKGSKYHYNDHRN